MKGAAWKVSVIGGILLVATVVSAKVHGPCSNCHTMHNSQSGNAVQAGGPSGNLLRDDCVGCHSSDTSETIKVIGSGTQITRIPIVYNRAEPLYPSTPTASGSSVVLAGGNFYWVEHEGDKFGHNVISHADSLLTTAPGNKNNCSNSCHVSLYSWSSPWFSEKGGCTSCHTPAHHKGGNATAIADEEDGWYRFLSKKHQNHSDNRSIKGYEDPDWQQTVSPSDHNEYWDSYQSEQAGISRFCGACHGDFHSTMYGPQNGGFYAGQWHAAPWFRHPAGIYLPDTGETSKYNTDGSGPEGTPGPYNPIAPVARQDVDSITTSSSVVMVGTDGAMVMCLSCHRAHGSPYADMLRWDYEGGCKANEANHQCGCFICHTNKD